jgi:hypothetical protein
MIFGDGALFKESLPVTGIISQELVPSRVFVTAGQIFHDS